MANPSLVVPVPDQTVTRGQSVSLSLVSNLVDPDAGDRLVYEISGLPVGTGITIDEDTGEVSASSITSADIAAAPISATVTARAASDDNIVESFTLTIEGGEVEPEPASTTFYVTNTGVSGAGTVGSPFSVAQRNNFNILLLSPTPVSHVDFLWTPGNYDNQPLIPRYGGISASVRVRDRVASAGTVRFRGPQNSGIHYGIEHRVGIYGGQAYTADFSEIMRESGKVFEVDGQAVAGAGAGEFGKGEAPDEVARIVRGAVIEGRNLVIDLDLTRTGGWNGLYIGPLAGPNVYRLNYTQHGTPWYPDGNDFGDQVWLDQGNGSRHVFEDGTSTLGGHSTHGILGGQGAIRCQTYSNSWGAVPTFSSTIPDGNRAMAISRAATNFHTYDCVFNRTGAAQDASPSDYTAEIIKLEGTNNTIADCVFRNATSHAFAIDSGAWSWHARGGRISHCVFETFRGPIGILVDWVDSPGDAGQSRLTDYQIKNCIIKNVADDPYSSWTDELFTVFCGSGVNWTTVFQMHGVTIEDATRDATQLYIEISNGIGAPGRRSLDYLLTNYPANFSNITVVTDCGLDDSPAAGTDILAEDLADYYTLNAGDTDSLGQGVALTLANGAGSSTTSLVVDDARWFDDPQDGNPSSGQQSIGFFVYINGANRQYTAINYTTNTLTLASAASWSDNAPVHRRIGSGSAPNRGYKR